MTNTVPSRVSRSWSLAVRRARPEDRDAVLAFTSDTWDGWDYIREVWDAWVADTVGAFLVATAEVGTEGEPPVDRDGAAFPPGRIVAITHLALLSATEGWVEGIRVDPAVRGMDVASDKVSQAIRAMATEISTKEEIASVAAISAQDREIEAAAVEPQLEKAWQRVEARPTSSCFCAPGPTLAAAN